MKAKLNNQLLKTTTFDSGSLGMLAMVIHQFDTVGHYRATIMQKGRSVKGIDFYVEKKSDVMQLSIDLAQADRRVIVRPGAYGRQRELEALRVVSPGGYVLFHVSSGAGYSVVVSNDEGKTVFDSAKLQDGDLFAVSLLEPTDYSMTNTLGSAEGEIAVSLTPEARRRIKTLETFYTDVGANGFDTQRIELTSSQGLVFRVKDSTRILIEKKSPLPVKRGKPTLRWQKPRTI